MFRSMCLQCLTEHIHTENEAQNKTIQKIYLNIARTINRTVKLCVRFVFGAI